MQNEFANAKNVCYLNSASEGILPQRAMRALQQAASEKQNPQVLGDERYYEMPARCRSLLGYLLHCSQDEIALIPSTSFGLSAIAHSLPLIPGDEILLIEKDFPSNNFAWEPLRDWEVRIKTIPFHPDSDQTGRVLESISERTRAISLSLVHFFTGFRYDLAPISEVCKQKEILLIVDAIHAAGTIELDLSKIHADVVCAAAHKWQLSPSGTGFLYINKDLMPRLRPAFQSWMHNHNANSFAAGNMFDYSPATTACRYELGTAPYVLLAAYEQSLQVLKECKIQYIEQHNIPLAGRARNFFRQIGWNVPDYRLPSSIAAARPPERYDVLTLLQKLAEKDVFVAVRENYMRVSPHFYNTLEDIDRFCAELKTLL